MTDLDNLNPQPGKRKESAMPSTIRLTTLAVLATFGVAAAAQAATFDAGGWRAQLRTGTAAAVVSGAVPAGEGMPDYPRPLASARARAEVRAETLAAMSAGTIERGEATPQYPQPVDSLLTRAEVNAETLAAIRLGLIASGEQPPRSATPAQAEIIRQAGLHAQGPQANRTVGAHAHAFHM